MDKYFAFYVSWLREGEDTNEIESVLGDAGVWDKIKIYGKNDSGRNIGGVVATHSSLNHVDLRKVFNGLINLNEAGTTSYNLMDDRKLSQFYEKVTGRKLRREAVSNRDYDAIENSLKLSGRVSVPQLKLLGVF